MCTRRRPAHSAATCHYQVRAVPGGPCGAALACPEGPKAMPGGGRAPRPGRRCHQGTCPHARAGAAVKVLATPRNPNPYQELLHGRLRTRGVEVRYLEGPTRSHTGNLALGPLVLAWARVARDPLRPFTFAFVLSPSLAPRTREGPPCNAARC